METSTSRSGIQLTLAKRMGCIAAGFTVGTVLLAVVAALFGQASSTPWLPDTREAAAFAARCDREPTPALRGACMRRVVADWQAGRRGDVRMASTR